MCGSVPCTPKAEGGVRVGFEGGVCRESHCGMHPYGCGPWKWAGAWGYRGVNFVVLCLCVKRDSRGEVVNLDLREESGYVDCVKGSTGYNKHKRAVDI